jgi:hypothetical protein
METPVTHQEKRAWIMLVVTAIAYAVYVSLILSRSAGQPLEETPYAATLLWTVGLSIVASIVSEMALGVVNPRASRVTDVRDREIGRIGDAVGHAFVLAGASGALLMALVDWPSFWIANAIYLGFVLSAIVGSIAKVIMYRKDVPRW